ncbi:MAG: hypothetical protein PVF93_12405 [Chromatiaceae bacterium]
MAGDGVGVAGPGTGHEDTLQDVMRAPRFDRKVRVLHGLLKNIL